MSEEQSAFGKAYDDAHDPDKACLNRLSEAGIVFQGGREWLANTKPREWLFTGMAVKGYLYAFTSPNNHGKTTVVAKLIARAISGAPFCGYKNTFGRMNVLLLCGENDIDTAHKILGVKEQYLLTDEDLDRLTIIARSFPMETFGDDVVDYANKLGIEFQLVIADTWQAYWSGGDMNSNDSQLLHAKAMRKLCGINGSPTVLVPAHPVKNASRDNLVPYGGGAAMNELDGNFEGWNDGGIFELTLGKKRQAPMAKMLLSIGEYTLKGLKDADGLPTTTSIAKSITEHEAEAIQIKQHDLKVSVLIAIKRLTDAGKKITRQSVAEECGLESGKIRYPLQQLAGAKGGQKPLIKSNPLEITKAGVSFLRDKGVK